MASAITVLSRPLLNCKVQQQSDRHKCKVLRPTLAHPHVSAVYIPGGQQTFIQHPRLLPINFLKVAMQRNTQVLACISVRYWLSSLGVLTGLHQSSSPSQWWPALWESVSAVSGGDTDITQSERCRDTIWDSPTEMTILWIYNRKCHGRVWC